MATEDDIRRAPLRAHILASINPYVAEKKKYSSRRRETSSRSKSRDKEERRSRAKPSSDGDDKLRPRGGKLRFKRKRDRAEDQDDSRRKTTSREDYVYDDDNDNDNEADDDRDDEAGRDRVDHRRRGQEDEGDADKSKEGETPSQDREHRHRHRHHRTKRRRSRTPSDPRRHRRRRDQEGQEEAAEGEGEDPYAEPPLDPDAAFRQSLFDAMADDEGAEYWEGVYGQPVHEYAREAAEMAAEMGNGNAQGGHNLEAMTDDQYAEYVRRRMWERSAEGIRETREKQKRAREQAEKEAQTRKAQEAREARRAQAAAEAARQQRQADTERRRRRAEALQKQHTWRDQWRAYGAAWTAWDAAPSAETIPWPGAAETGRLSGEALVEAARVFFAGHEDGVDLEQQTLARRLRDERVRWHPDKIQQRLGGSVDAAILRDVTAVFQVVDDLWSAARQK